jgi:hypothetical protein
MPCPQGYYCPCGQPVPCPSAAFFCVANLIEPSSVSPGYYSVSLSSNGSVAAATSGTNNGTKRSSQRGCTEGSFCVDGVRIPCFAGSYGIAPRQASSAACPSCPAGRYNALRGKTSIDTCLACPTGTLATSPGAAFCMTCPVGEYPTTTWLGSANASSFGPPVMTSCTVCPFGTLALPGMAVCVANDDVALTRTTAFSALQVLHNYDPTAKNALFSSNTQKMVSVPIFMLAILPLVIVIASTMPTKARNLPPGFVNFFRGIDLYAMRHALQEHQSPTLRRTLLGGAFSIVALGTILSIAASLVVQYATNNTLTQRSVLPAMLPTLEELAVLPAFTSSDATDSTSVPPLLDAIAPSFDTLMQVNIHAMGPLCRNISVMQTGILTGVFTLGSVVDNSTLAVQHTLKCDGCALGPLSALNMSLDASCQSLRVEAIASGATGSVTVVAFSTLPCGLRLLLSGIIYGVSIHGVCATGVHNQYRDHE